MIIQKNVSLAPFNTFGMQATAKEFTVLHSIEDVQQLLAADDFKKQRVLILGGGSNVLLTKNFDGLVAKVEILGKKVIHKDDEQVVLHVGAGENWHAFVMYCVDNNWGGIENLSLIPGTVGAAPMQNIGAYGVEIKDVIDSVEAIDVHSGAMRTFSNEECRFGYRESIFKQEVKDQYIITGVTLRLTTKNHRFNSSYGAVTDTMKVLGYHEASVRAISDAVIHIRRSKLPDPAQIGNAGSFFKNPTIDAALYESLKKTYIDIPGYTAGNNMFKVPAAWLIEQCGWKGKRFNNIGVHQHQALVLVNYGGGEGEKIWELAMKIQLSVKEKFNITLHPEVNVV
ncbi:MAG TPA: UDP-N-acetylmuramate dehydrogenase [Ohtaekwangia sp.]|uniref:UDP-N-acetylmuramate dehydrogenase n=1 Tax=Ohtaekwangia sp. TaxID=2066019 RepID=UPI002F94CC39